MTDFLLELGTEEIPAGYIGPAIGFMASFFEERLARIKVAHAGIRRFSTPRRLAVAVAGLPDRGPDSVDEFRGPGFEAAFDSSGAPKPAAEGFAKSKGLKPGDLAVRDTPKGKYVFAIVTRPGAEMSVILAAAAAEMIPAIPWPKSMKWGGGAPPFARPLRYVFAKFGANPARVEVQGVEFSERIRLHPFMGGDRWASIADADAGEYARILREGFVYADRAERMEILRAAVVSAVERQGGVFRDEELLEEVVDLVEYPNAAVGSFDRAYLGVPAAVLEAAMTEHQRYFPVRTAGGRLKPRFVTALNRRDRTRQIVKGNERVLRARLNDASFFFAEDRKKSLESRVPGLAGVVYLKGGGSLLEKAGRLRLTAERIAGAAGLDGRTKEAVLRAASLCKADLLTEVVGEFPSLQGRMGGIYSGLDGEDKAVARAIEEHYMPRTQGADLPASGAGRVLALADRIQTLADCFALGLKPSGSRDPYGLRRSAIGIARIILDSGWRIGLGDALAFAAGQAPGAGAESARIAAECGAFLRERIYQSYIDRGFPHDIVEAALGAGDFLDVADLEARISALMSVKGREWWPALVELSERTSNITKGFEDAEAPSGSLCVEKAEKDLFEALAADSFRILALIESGRYVEAAEAYQEAFGTKVHEFFEHVFVNVDDPGIRANRLRLVKAAGGLFNGRVANLSLVVTGRKTQ